jgi:hypothetical protein
MSKQAASKLENMCLHCGIPCKVKYCTVQCHMKHRNPGHLRKTNGMFRQEVRDKVSAKLREMGHKPKIRGGNGTPQILATALLEQLGSSWVLEKAVPTGIAKGNGYPTCYKLDLAHRTLKLGVELDGSSHSALSRKEQDRKKDTLLQRKGWIVLRFSNKEFIQNSSDVARKVLSTAFRLKAHMFFTQTVS